MRWGRPRRRLCPHRPRLASDGRHRAWYRLATGHRAPDGATVYCGATPLTLTFPENREFVRTMAGDGTVVDHVDQIDFVTHPDQTITPATVPHHVLDICAELGLG